MVRLRDIAEKAGVSVMTVSKALRDAKDISVKTKARIRQLALEMGYVPDAMAQSLRTRSTRLLGVMIASSTNPIFSRTLMALEEWAFQLGYEILVYHSLNQPDREETCIRRMLARRVDGMFLAPVYRFEHTAPIYEELKRQKTPLVILGRRAPFCGSFPSVEVDEAAASESLTRHLIENGHRRIAFFAGPQVSPSANDRLEGYRRALREAEIEADDRLVFAAGSTIDEGAKAAAEFINEGCSATAIQCVNDLVAVGAGNVLLNQGVRIPTDVSLTGFGNILTSEHFRVPLTTARQPKFRLGAQAMEMMQAMLRHEQVKNRLLSAEVALRQSSGPAPRK
jgi:DNA-binding LacI/PurR family transcriptional regulator